jgi:hypothetical protein
VGFSRRCRRDRSKKFLKARRSVQNFLLKRLVHTNPLGVPVRSSPERSVTNDCSAQPNKPFAISAIPKAFIPHIWRQHGCECSGPFDPLQRAAKE